MYEKDVRCFTKEIFNRWVFVATYFIGIGLPADVGVCAAGETEIVNQALKPAGLCSSANSA